MSDPASSSGLPPQKPSGRPRMSALRVAIWVVVGGLGVYLVITGVVGMVSKG